MKKQIFHLALFSFILFYSGLTAAEPSDPFLFYRGAADASAAVALNESLFLVADDENNTLRLYSTQRPGLPLDAFDLTAFLAVDPEHPEADLEGAAQTPDRIYWISSHGRNKDGKLRPSRYRFFATAYKLENNRVAVTPLGRPCTTLIHSLVKSDLGRRLNLDRYTRLNDNLKKKDRKKLAPKNDGLNIEALAAAPDGHTLYLGFRNPRPPGPDSRPAALVIPLLNPADVVEHARTPRFGEPLLWNLAGRTLRAMDYIPLQRAYYIVAGPIDEETGFILYCWSGEADSPPAPLKNIFPDHPTFKPEALLVFPRESRLLLLSDDGALPVKVTSLAQCRPGELSSDGFCPNKFLTDPARRTFRAAWLTPPHTDY